MKVREVVEEFQFLQELAEDPDVDQEAFDEALKTVNGDIKHLSKYLASIRGNVLDDAESSRKEADRLTKRARALENNAKSILAKIEFLMRACEMTDLKTDLYSFKIQKNPPSLVIDNEDLIPPEYLKVKYEANKEAIKEAIKSGEEIEWARLVQTEGLRIR